MVPTRFYTVIQWWFPPSFWRQRRRLGTSCHHCSFTVKCRHLFAFPWKSSLCKQFWRYYNILQLLCAYIIIYIYMYVYIYIYTKLFVYIFTKQLFVYPMKIFYENIYSIKQLEINISISIKTIRCRQGRLHLGRGLGESLRCALGLAGPAAGCGNGSVVDFTANNRGFYHHQ